MDAILNIGSSALSLLLANPFPGCYTDCSGRMEQKNLEARSELDLTHSHRTSLLTIRNGIQITLNTCTIDSLQTRLSIRFG